jgi:hypothetical protein
MRQFAPTKRKQLGPCMRIEFDMCVGACPWTIVIHALEISNYEYDYHDGACCPQGLGTSFTQVSVVAGRFLHLHHHLLEMKVQAFRRLQFTSAQQG